MITNRDDLQDRFDDEIAAMGVRIKDANQFKVREDVFDDVTLLALYKLVHKKHLSVIGGSISTGKEANVFYAEHDGEPIALKIYRVRSANFTTMGVYMTGDRRFSGIGTSRKALIFAWAKKEFSNLKRAAEAGIPVPKPLIWDRNILLIGFLGKDEQPYPQLRNVTLEDPAATYETIIGYIKTLYTSAKLVHADLSEYNILYGDQVYMIDMGQSVTLDHPQALRFLVRDIQNINRFFRTKTEVMEEKEIFTAVTGISSDYEP